MDTELERLKRKLDLLIENGASKEEIYEMSVRIDKKLVDYYRQNTLGEVAK